MCRGGSLSFDSRDMPSKAVENGLLSTMPMYGPLPRSKGTASSLLFTRCVEQLERTQGFLEFYLEHLERARELVEDSHKLLLVYNHAVPKTLGGALETDMLEEQVAWIREELT